MFAHTPTAVRLHYLRPVPMEPELRGLFTLRPFLDCPYCSILPPQSPRHCSVPIPRLLTTSYPLSLFYPPPPPQQGRILPDIITSKHLVNVGAQERAHLALLKVHNGNNLPDQPCTLRYIFARVPGDIDASTAVGGRRFTSLRNPCDTDRYSSLQDIIKRLESHW